MPHPNKKIEAILLAVPARGAKRRAAMEPDTSELVSVDGLASECDDLEEEEYDEQEIQDLSMT
ncbi:hypothetical protein BDZ91DRAFT_712806, partial [Kalaharituber pfeilii]